MSNNLTSVILWFVLYERTVFIKVNIDAVILVLYMGNIIKIQYDFKLSRRPLLIITSRAVSRINVLNSDLSTANMFSELNIETSELNTLTRLTSREVIINCNSCFSWLTHFENSPLTFQLAQGLPDDIVTFGLFSTPSWIVLIIPLVLYDHFL